MDVCTNYRYMRRKDELLNMGSKKEDQTVTHPDLTETKKKGAKKPPAIKGLKKGKQDQPPEEPVKS